MTITTEPEVKRTPRARQAVGALLGIDQPTYMVMTPHRPWQSRLRRWALRKAARMVWKACRRMVGWRRPLAPLYLAMVVWLAAALASTVHRGWVTLGAASLVGAVPLYWWLGGPMGRFGRVRRLKPRNQRIWYAAFYAALSMWAVAASATTVLPPMLGALLLIAVTNWIAWMWYRRTRTDATELDAVDGRQATWATVKPLVGTVMLDPVELTNPRRFEADIDTSATELLVKDVVAAVPHIAKRFKRPTSSIIADYGRSRLEHLAKLTVVYDNPCEEPVAYDESWIPTEQDIADGCVPFHLFPNGMRARVRLWLPGAGTVNTLFSGDIRTGKSVGMETKMIQACFTGKVWPMVADPQGGVSMPTWCAKHDRGAARWQAIDEDGIYAQLCAFEEAMYARSDAMSEFRWVDKWGDERIGINCWDPSIPGMPPAVAWSCDEFWRLMLIDDFYVIFKKCFKMMNKTGMYMDIATQYPGIEEFHNDMAMRQPLTAGNLLCYRNTAGSTKEMILPKELPPPNGIPWETPDGNHTKGMLIAASQAPRSSLPVYSRSVWAERGRWWADKAAERVPELDETTKAVFAKHMPEATLHANGFVAPERKHAAQGEADQPARGRVEVAAAEQPRAKRLTAFEKIAAYLKERPNGQAHTGVIAQAIDEKLTTVSTALGRAEKVGKAHQVDYGVWALGSTPNQQLTFDEEAA